ncbi:MAG TPA: methyltransferase domain-containing protein [Burkholderiales bacterium]|nr:methyltransferase domain-containing protein [Burkholderiales bacterium]
MTSLRAADVGRTGGPFVPTPQAVVDAMLEVARVGPSDFVIDLGSGDGRIVLTAAQRYNARGLGIDIDPELVRESNAEAQRRGLGGRVAFRQQDVLQAKIGDASVVTLYLLPGMMQQLQAKFARELKPGTRIVSHDFPFGDWKPDREVSVEVPEKYGSPGQWKSTVFYWIVPARVAGVWKVSAPELFEKPLTLSMDQQFQFVSGGSTDEPTKLAISEGRVRGQRVSFKLTLPGGTFEFRGVIERRRIRGEAVQGARTVPFTAERADTATAELSRRTDK